jgi:hypothetical protein
MSSKFHRDSVVAWGTREGRAQWLKRLLSLKAGDDRAFGKLFGELLSWQTRRLPRLRQWLERHGWLLERDLDRWKEVPAVPQSLYKVVELYTQALPSRYEFLTSGTTSGGAHRGRVRLRAMDIYRGVCVAGARAAGVLRPNTSGILAFSESPQGARHSSLSWMIAFWMRALPKERRKDCFWYVRGGVFDVERLAKDLERRAGDPILLVGTAFAWVHFIEFAETRRWGFCLHPEACVIETGGYKGRSREFSRDELYGALERVLGVRRSQIGNEYGMTELSSQAYAVGGEGVHRAPAWLRLCVVDPLTFLPLPEGREGVVKAIDLANVDWPSVVLTADRAVAAKEGIYLLGREVLNDGGRGCSLPVEDWRIEG